MLGWLKTLLVSGFVIGLVVFSGVTMTQQNSNTRATMEVEGALMTALLGDSRGQGMDSGINKDEFVTAVVGSIVDTQKNHGKTVKISYIFIDKGGNETTVDTEIRSIQFKTEIMNRKNPTETDSVSEKRVTLDVIGNRSGEVGNGLQTKVIVFEPGIESRTKIETVGTAASIGSVTVNNGNVTHTVNGDKITVNVTGGTRNRTLVSGAITPAHTKYVQGESTPNYKKDNYVGTLEKYASDGQVSPEDTIYVDKQLTPTYKKDGYQGTLDRYVVSGEYIPEETKTVTNQTGSNYNSGGFTGILAQYVSSGKYTPESKQNIMVNPIRKIYYEVYGGELKRELPSDFVLPSGVNQWVRPSGEGHGWFDYSFHYQTIRHIIGPYAPGYPDGSRVHVATEYFDSEMAEVVVPATDTRVYRYQGTVRKPGVDTRKYAYRGEVTKSSTDTLGYLYRGYVTKPQTDTRVYNEGYTYTVTIKYRN